MHRLTKTPVGWHMIMTVRDESVADRRLDIVTSDHGDSPPSYLIVIARHWAAAVVSDKDTRADIDKLGDAVGIDTKGGKKADALKALRSGR